MTTIDFPTLMTLVFVLVDDWYQREMLPQQPPRPGAKARFSDSEVLTLALLMDYLPFPGETQFLGFIRANYASWFPQLLDQSQFNRRLRHLDGPLEALRRNWVTLLVGPSERHFIIDTKPIPVLGLKRDKRYSDFAGNAAPGYCAAQQMYYFGYKLALLCTTTGVPIAFDVVPANTDERAAVEATLQTVRHSEVYGDKGFLSDPWQRHLQQHSGNRLWTVHRSNQNQQHPPNLKRFISKVRQRIEGVFHEIQNTGRNPERLLSKTVAGLVVHLSAKMASHTLRLLLKQRYGIDVLIFQQHIAET